MSTLIQNEWLVNFPSGANKPHATIDEGGMLWVGTESSPATLTRIDPANPTAAQTLTFPSDGQHNWIIDILYVPAKGKIYALFVNSLSGDRTVVSEIDPSTFPSPSCAVDVINDSSTGHACAQGSFCVDSTYMYISTGIFSANAVLLKYNLANWIFIAPLTLSFNPGSGTKYLQIGHNCRYDGTNIFVSSANSDLTTYLAFVRVDPGSFTVVDGASLTVGADTTLTDDSAFTAAYVWYGSETTGNIVRVLKTNLSSQTRILTVVGPPNWGVWNDGTFLWSIYGTTPGTAVRVDPNTLALATFTFPSGLGQNSSNEVLSDGTYLFFTGFTIPGWASAASLALMDGIIATPVFSPAPAGFPGPLFVTITSTPGATIRYTLDGSTPSESNGTVYSSPVAISTDSTLRAIAYYAGSDSTIASGVYTIIQLSGQYQEQQRGIGTSTIVPLTTAPNQSMTVNLPINGGTLTLNLDIRYNENGLNGNFWSMDIADQYGNPLVSSVPLVTGTWPGGNILAPWDYLFIGSATVLNISGGSLDIPDSATLGTSFVLCWAPN
jgi:hypothetical protein